MTQDNVSFGNLTPQFGAHQPAQLRTTPHNSAEPAHFHHHRYSHNHRVQSGPAAKLHRHPTQLPPPCQPPDITAVPVNDFSGVELREHATAFRLCVLYQSLASYKQ